MVIYLITGITGFVGSHLAELLLKEKCEVHGIKRYRSSLENVLHIQDDITWWECDLTDSTAVQDMIKKVKPDELYHLAAQSYVPPSWINPHSTLNTNIIGTLNIFEAAREIESPRILNCSSAEVYGVVQPEECPIKETNPLRPVNIYSISKIGQDLLANVYHKSYGLDIITTRAFTHTGPRRNEVFVFSNFAKQIAEIELGLREPVIHVGNLDSVRTITDVRDMVKAYRLALQYCDAGEAYNIGSKQTFTIREALNLMLKFTEKNVTVKVDPDRLRPAETPLQIPDASKFIKKTGWKPEIPAETTLRNLFDYWKEKLSNEQSEQV